MSKVSISTLPPTLSQAMISTGVWQDSSPVSLKRLALITTPYVDFSGREHTAGEIVVMDSVAKHVAQIFAALYKMRFPIHKMRSVHHYAGDDQLSMADNNSSCYCYRPIEGSTLTSLHSYGLAIDLNPLQNPFVLFDEKQGQASIYPKSGWEYLNRHNQKPGMAEPVITLLAEHGFFIWGGHWTTPIDYHHFQPQRGIAELLTILTTEDGERFIDSAILQQEHLSSLSSMPYGEALQPLVDLYQNNKSDFFDLWPKYIVSNK